MVIFLGFNLAETTLARPRGQAQQKPNFRKAPVVEDECEENPAQWKAHHAGNRGSEKPTQQKAHAAQPQILEDLWLR